MFVAFVAVAAVVVVAIAEKTRGEDKLMYRYI
jgi:hypothetical protein